MQYLIICKCGLSCGDMMKDEELLNHEAQTVQHKCYYKCKCGREYMHHTGDEDNGDELEQLVDGSWLTCHNRIHNDVLVVEALAPIVEIDVPPVDPSNL